MSHEETTRRVRESLFACTAHDMGGPRRRHITEEDLYRLACRWLLAVVRDREENGPLIASQAQVNGVLPPREL